MTYSTVIHVWSQCIGRDSAKAVVKAEALFARMERLYESGENTQARPNVVAHNIAMHVWSKHIVDAHDSADRVEAILKRMQNYGVQPDEVRKSFQKSIFISCLTYADEKGAWWMIIVSCQSFRSA